MNTSKNTITVNNKWMTVAELEVADNLTVNGPLYLSDSSISKLPNNLTVNGTLSLFGTTVTTLPNNLYVGGSLDIGETAITTLPDDLFVGACLNLGEYIITFYSMNTANMVKIGCKYYSLNEWEQFTDKSIFAMDGKRAVEFWKTWRTQLLKYGYARLERSKHIK